MHGVYLRVCLKQAYLSFDQNIGYHYDHKKDRTDAAHRGANFPVPFEVKAEDWLREKVILIEEGTCV